MNTMGELIGLSEAGHNSDAVEFEAGSVLELVDAIEEEQAKIDANNAEAKEKNAPYRDGIATLKKQARDEYNVESSALSLLIAKRRQERRILEREGNLKEKARSQYGMFGNAA